MSTSKSIPAVGYIRVSTERQAGEVHTSLADQRTAIEALAARLGVTVGAWHEDAGASGATVDGRPAFRNLLAWCEATPRRGEPGFVLVLNDSRFGRFPDPEEAAYWRHHLRRHGWVVRFAEGDEGEGTARVVMRAIGAAQASEYRENLIRNTRRGMKGAASQGFWTRRAPFGYRRRVVYGGPDRILAPAELKTDAEKVRLHPYEPEAEIVRWIFESYVSRKHSASSLARVLQDRVPERKWSPTTVHAVLRNAVYMGDVVGGRRRSAKGGHTTEPELYGLRDAHPAIISRSLWEAARKRMAENGKVRPGARTPYLLSGIMRCTRCGQVYTGGGGGRSHDAVKVREFRRFYRDTGGVSGCCPGRIGTVMRHIIDGTVVDTLAEVVGSSEVMRAIERAFTRATSSGGEDRATGLRAARARLEQKRDRLVASIADGILRPEEAAPQLQKVRESLAEVERQLEGERTRGSARAAAQEERARLVKIARDFGGVARRLAAAGRAPELRTLVEPWIREVTFDKATRELVLSIAPLPADSSLQTSISPGPGSP